MEHYRLSFDRGHRPAFGEAPVASRRRAFGVDYVRIRGMQGGELFFTRAGWALGSSLLPRVWYDNERFRRIGKALQKATGSVYLVPVPHPARRNTGIVVKFCRFAQDVGCTRVESGLLPPEVAPLVGAAEFAGPFEEFGLVRRLRAYRGPQGVRFRTMMPLAIYCPPTHYAPWQMGRDQSRYWRYDAALAAGQEEMPAGRRIVHHWDRIYVLLYQWIEGIDLEEATVNNLMPAEDVSVFTLQVSHDLLAAGYAVLDHKARHIIVRPDLETGRLIRHGGRIVHALIDYELLVPVARPAAAASS